MYTYIYIQTERERETERDNLPGYIYIYVSHLCTFKLCYRVLYICILTHVHNHDPSLGVTRQQANLLSDYVKPRHWQLVSNHHIYHYVICRRYISNYTIVSITCRVLKHIMNQFI